MDIVAQRRQTLIAINQDNAVLEGGDAVLQGSETFKAGSYFRFVRGAGNVRSDYYCPQVVHQFAPFRSYTTTVTLERGTGFVDRLQMSSSPYLAELDIGGVYGD
jgi:hypothetical protein